MEPPHCRCHRSSSISCEPTWCAYSDWRLLKPCHNRDILYSRCCELVGCDARDLTSQTPYRSGDMAFWSEQRIILNIFWIMLYGTLKHALPLLSFYISGQNLDIYSFLSSPFPLFHKGWGIFLYTLNSSIPNKVSGKLVYFCLYCT